MANRIKLKGTTERVFDLGLTNKQTFDASNLTANRTWVLPDSAGSPNYVLQTDGAGNLSWTAQTGGGGTPGGNTTEVQFNDAGSFGGDADFTWNKTTNTLTIAGDVTAVDSLTFDTTAAETSAVAKLYWDDGDGTLSSGLKGGNVTARLGQNLYTLVYNAQGSTINKGQVVYVFGAQGQRPSVKLAQANADATSARTMGIVAETITAGAEGFICIEGDVDNINTLGLTEGGQLYLSGTTPGAYTQSKPSAPIHLVYVGICLKASATAGRIQVKVQNGYELDELHDVKITNPVTANSMLQYDNANSLWINSTPSTVINNIVPTQSGNTGNFLKTNGSSVSWAYAVTGAVGNTGHIQYNNAGNFAASDALMYSNNASLATLTIGNTAIGQAGRISLPYTSGTYGPSVIDTNGSAFFITAGMNTSGLLITGPDANIGNNDAGQIWFRGGNGAGTSGKSSQLYFSTAGNTLAKSGNIVFASFGGYFSLEATGAIRLNNVSGNTGQVLTSQGANAAPIWANVTATGGATIDDCIVYAIALS